MKIKITAIIAAFFSACCFQVCGQPPAAVAGSGQQVIINVPNRETTSLDGQWQIIIDPMETGFYDFQYQENPNGFFKNWRPPNKSDLVEYNFDASEQVHVPGDWNSQKPELLWYEGTIWYKKSFTFDEKAGKRLFLNFEAVNYNAKVYLNGEKLGEHIGGFTPFTFEISGKIKKGENFVIVKVDNTRKHEAVPTVNFDWWNYGGITRSVSLVETPRVFIEDYFIQLKKGNRREVEGYIKLSGPGGPQEVSINIPERKFTKKIKTNNTGYARVNFSQEFELWSPGNPKLYEVIITAGDDTIKDEIGFRTIETKGQDILLNGKSIFLKGVCVHEESPFRGGRAHSVEDARILLGWAKEMGCNYVRLSHYTHNENMIREADRLGLLVWAEIPLYWTIQWKNPGVMKNARNQFFEMYSRDKNRAAVILWALANETPQSEERLSFLGELAGYVRKLDNTRLLTAATFAHREKDNKNLIVIEDPLGAYLDVLGCNQYFGWYGSLPEVARPLVWTTAYNKPLIMSEFGGEAQYGRHGDKLERWTEEYQEYFFRENLDMQRKIPFLRGMSPWLLMDFRSPKRHMPKIQDHYNRKGLISDQGQKKKAFFVMRDFYDEINKKYQ